MLRNLKDLFDTLLAAPQGQATTRSEHTLELATAVLLIEVMRADADIGDAERAAVIAALRSKFALAKDEVDRLYELAEQASRNATDTYAFTSRVNAGFDAAQKARMIEHMWRVAYADGRLSAHENHVMRKVSDLLYVPHGDYIAAKMRAKGEAGQA